MMAEDGRDGLAYRLWGQIVASPSGCYLWCGTTNGRGYGTMWNQGRKVLAHRLMYEIYIGPIPQGLQVDHLCRNRGCVRPEHLEPVTCKENLRRGDHSNRRKTSCPQGHPYSESNTYSRPSRTERSCRVCHREGNQRWYYRHCQKASEQSEQ